MRPAPPERSWAYPFTCSSPASPGLFILRDPDPDVGFLLYCDQAEKILQEKDPGRIVIDEIAGFQFALFLIRRRSRTLQPAFILFRFFDIVKVFPANLCETRLPGGYAVVMDDVISGIYANLVLQIIILLSGI